MKVILRGPLAAGTGGHEVQFPVNVAMTREDLLRTLAGQSPAVARFLGPSAETGSRVALLVLAGGNWIHPGQVIAGDAEVEIHPPICGG